VSNSRYTHLASLAMLLGRFIIIFGLIPNGMRKLADFSQTAAGIGGIPQLIDGRPFPAVEPLFYFPFPQFFLGCSVLFDMGGAVLIILGLFTRPVAAWMCFYCLLAMTIFHHDLAVSGNVMSLMRGLPLVGGLLFIAGAGAGAWSLDAWRGRR
jgi:putative oxidoreductase